MKRLILYLFLFILFLSDLEAQQETFANSFVLENTFNLGYIVQNSGDVPNNKVPFLFSINPSFQTGGREDWHQTLGFPRVGFKFTLGYLGNKKELGNLIGFTPNLTFRTSSRQWYSPAVNLGLGLAWFNKPYDAESNPHNFYIGSHITAMAEASVQIEPRISDKLNLITGLRVVHCSNSHYQVPNLGMNLLAFYMGVSLNPSASRPFPALRSIDVPKPRLHLNFRSGIGVHELARTLGPTGTPKYKIYVNDIYVSRLFGKVSNVHAGVEVNYYKSFYNYIVTNNFFEEDRKLKSTVITAFLAHELMIKRFSLLTQGGINLYNKFYNAYISQYKSESGLTLELKKIFSTRLGLQYYLFDPKYCSRTNVFVGAYIKANFGQADFACFQVGIVL